MSGFFTTIIYAMMPGAINTSESLEAFAISRGKATPVATAIVRAIGYLARDPFPSGIAFAYACGAAPPVGGAIEGAIATAAINTAPTRTAHAASSRACSVGGAIRRARRGHFARCAAPALLADTNAPVDVAPAARRAFLSKSLSAAWPLTQSPRPPRRAHTRAGAAVALAMLAAVGGAPARLARRPFPRSVTYAGARPGVTCSMR
mmetsp:Transcript_17331/g.38907  ORF Transcript_17331/g.38907 Transcript_17331/m.38907 type:complete len:205 (-) Transcript_17331:906-1520(-)